MKFGLLTKILVISCALVQLKDQFIFIIINNCTKFDHLNECNFVIEVLCFFNSKL